MNKINWIFLILFVALSAAALSLRNEPEYALIIVEDNDGLIIDNCRFVEPNEPNEPEYDITLWVDGNSDANDIAWDVNDTNIVYGDYFMEYDPNMVVDFSYFLERVSFYFDNNHEWAEFNHKCDGIVSCNISQEAFLKDLPQFLYNFMGKVDPNVQYVIEWAEPNEVVEYHECFKAVK